MIGTIGKTHGVSSDSAPTVIASHTNDQMEPCRCTGAVCPAQMDEADAVAAVEPGLVAAAGAGGTAGGVAWLGAAAGATG